MFILSITISALAATGILLSQKPTMRYRNPETGRYIRIYKK
jgi:hypothetical protein